MNKEEEVNGKLMQHTSSSYPWNHFQTTLTFDTTYFAIPSKGSVSANANSNT